MRITTWDIEIGDLIDFSKVIFCDGNKFKNVYFTGKVMIPPFERGESLLMEVYCPEIGTLFSHKLFFCEETQKWCFYVSKIYN